jgi:hypothetical protein
LAWGVLVWEATVRVDQSVPVAAGPEAAWSLLRSPEAWSARPRSCLTFELTDPLEPTGTEGGPARPRFYLAAADTGAHSAVLEITAELPGQQLCLQTSGGRATWALSVEPGRRGTRLRIATTWTVDRPARIHAEADLRRELKEWLAALRDIADGRRSRPADSLPEALRQACLASPPPGPAVDVSASAQIDVPPDIVERVLARPDFMREVQPAGAAYVARVPGTPGHGAVGGMVSFVARGSDGVLAGSVSLLAASSPGARLYRRVTPPFYETTYRSEPAGDGTRWEVTRRCAGHSAADPARHAEWHAAGVAAIAARYKATVERLARIPS